MTSSPSFEDNPNVSSSSSAAAGGGAPAILTRSRRREKRRHDHDTTTTAEEAESSSSSPAVDSLLKVLDPLEILSLAIRLDEATGDEELLLEPLERGQLYSHSQETFLKAMAYLEEQTTTTTGSSGSSSSRRRRRKSSRRRPALTPIILSGLIAEQMKKLQQQQQDSTATATTTLPSTTTAPSSSSSSSMSDMVLFCNAKRQQALTRLRKRKRRNRLWNWTIVGGVLCWVIRRQWHVMQRMQHALVELGYVGLVAESAATTTATDDDARLEQYEYNGNLTKLEELFPLQPCTAFDASDGYEDACFVAEARLWTFLEDYALQASRLGRQPSCALQQQHCPDSAKDMIHRQIYKLPGRAEEAPYGDQHAPYAMHTVLFREETFLDMGAKDRIRVNSVEQELGWLGNSLLNHYVQTAIQQVYKEKSSNQYDDMPLFRVLDVGCGVGGLLYTLMPKVMSSDDDDDDDDDDGSIILFKNLDYTGIAISAPEIRTARMLRDEHGIESNKARFLQMSFDDPRLADTNIGGPYDVIVATESLAFSKNIERTMLNLKRSLSPQGLMIIFDDVEHGPRSNRTSSELLVGMRSRLTALSEATGRSTLLTHTEWVDMFEEMDFSILLSSDVGLYDSMPLLVVSADGDTPSPKHISGLLFEASTKMTRRLPGSERWAAFLLNTLQRLEDWTRGGERSASTTTTMAAARTMQLIREEVRASRARKLRKASLEWADTTFNQYNIRSNGYV